MIYKGFIMKNITTLITLSFLMSSFSLFSGNFSIKNTTNDDVLIEATVRWCDVWGKPVDDIFMALARGIDVAAAGAVTAIVSGVVTAQENGVALRVRPCTKGGSEKNRYVIKPGETLDVGKLGVWYDVAIINLEGTPIDQNSPLRLQGKQMELYRTVHIPADQTWELKAVNLDDLGYAGKYGEAINK